MPRYAAPPAWRTRRAAINKKGLFDAELLMESDALPAPAAKDYIPHSPVSVFDQPEHLPEMKSFTLPGQWTVVGKGGKPVKNDKLYLEPPAKKKKKRNRMRKEVTEDDSLARLAEQPSSSKCLQMLTVAEARRDKLVLGARERKHWQRYQQTKAVKAYARDMLEILLVEGDMPEDKPEGSTLLRPPKAMIQHSCKGNSHTEKVRRKNRFASQDARCYPLEAESEEEGATQPPPKVSGKKTVKQDTAQGDAPRARLSTKRKETPRSPTRPATAKQSKGAFKQAEAAAAAKGGKKGNCSVM